MPVARGITQTEYDEKARELKERQIATAARLEQHRQGDEDYGTTLESLRTDDDRANSCPEDTCTHTAAAI